MSEQVNEKVLNADQRRKRAMVMRRYKEKLKRARELAKSKQAPEKNIKKRAAKLARETVRERVAGERGKKYSELSTSEKIAVDKLIDTPEKIKMIRKLAQRLIPKVRRMEQERLMSFLKGHQLKNLGKPEGNHTVNEELNKLFNEYFASAGLPGRGAMGGPAQTSNKMIGKDKKKDNGKTIIQYQPFQDEKKNPKVNEALARKAEKSGIDFDILSEVYSRGLAAYPENCKVTLEQYAFARVNSFINQGKTYFNEDADLQEASTNSDRLNDVIIKHPKYVGYNIKGSNAHHLSNGIKAYVTRSGPDVIAVVKDGKNSIVHKSVASLKRHLYEDAELQERNEKNARMRKTMDAARGAKYKLTNKVPDPEEKHKTPLAHNKAIGRALRNEDCASNEKVDKLKSTVNKLKAAHKSEKAHDKALGESISRMNSPGFSAAKKNLADLRSGKVEKQKKEQSALAKYEAGARDYVKHLHGEYKAHKAAHKEHSDAYHAISKNPKGHGFESKEQAHGALEELQGLIDHHAHEMEHHRELAHFHNNLLKKPMKLKEDIDLQEENGWSVCSKNSTWKPISKTEAEDPKTYQKLGAKHARNGKGPYPMHSDWAQYHYDKGHKAGIEAEKKLKESRFYNTFNSGKAASIQNRLNKRPTEAPSKSKWNVELKLKDGSIAKHEVEGTDFHNAVMKAKELDPTREFHPLGGHRAKKINESRDIDYPVNPKDRSKDIDYPVKSKKRSNIVHEGKMKELSVDVKDLDNGNFKKKYGKSKEQMTFDLGKPKDKPVTEAKKMKGKDPCWKGYTMVGTKKKNGKEVPNCVPTNEELLHEQTVDSFHKHVKAVAQYLKANDKIHNVHNVHSGEKVHSMAKIHLNKDHDSQHVFNKLKGISYRKMSGYDSKPNTLRLSTNHDSMITQSEPLFFKSKHGTISAKYEVEHGSNPKLIFTHHGLKESAPEIGAAPIPQEKAGTKARKQIQTVPRQDDNREETGRSTRHQEVLKKIIHEKLGNKTEDPKKREVGTDDIVATYKADTPFAEEAKSSDRKPVVIPSFTRRNDDGSTVTIPSKTVLRKSNRKIVGDGNPHDGKSQ